MWGKRGPNATVYPKFSWVGLALGWGVRRFQNNVYIFSNPTEFWLIAKTTTPAAVVAPSPRRLWHTPTVSSYAALFRRGGGAASHLRHVRRRGLEEQGPTVFDRAQGARGQDHQLVGVQERA